MTIEHTTNILEDHSFTEFMGVSDGKDFDGLADCSVGEPSSRTDLTIETGRKGIPEGPPDAGQLHSKIENDQVITPEAAPFSSTFSAPLAGHRPTGSSSSQ